MKLLYNTLFIAATLLGSKLYAMEQPTSKKKVTPLTVIAYNALEQAQLPELQAIYPDDIQNKISPSVAAPIVEFANYILGLFKYENSDTRAQALNALELKKKFQIASYFLKDLAQRNTSDDCHKIAFIHYMVMLLAGSDLLNFRYKLLNYTGELLKLINSNNQRDERSIAALGNKLKALGNMLDLSAEKATQNLKVINRLEQIPPFEKGFEEIVKQVIEEQDHQEWEAFTIEILKAKGIDPDSFFKYLFAAHIPSKEFESEQSFRGNCDKMIEYIEKILKACKSEADLSKIFHYLFTIYPATTNILCMYNHAISAQKWLNNSTLIDSTLLCPKLFLLYELKNIFFLTQCKILTHYLNNNKTDECASTIINIYYTFFDTRLISILLRDIVKLNAMGELVKDKFWRLDRFAKSLEICLSEIQLPTELINQLSDYYTSHIRNFFPPNATVPDVEKLINKFQATFKNASNNSFYYFKSN